MIYFLQILELNFIFIAPLLFLVKIFHYFLNPMVFFFRAVIMYIRTCVSTLSMKSCQNLAEVENMKR